MLIGGSPEYVGSEYSAYEDMVRAGHAKHRLACGERRSFTSTAKCVEFFDSNEHCARSLQDLLARRLHAAGG